MNYVKLNISKSRVLLIAALLFFVTLCAILLCSCNSTDAKEQSI